MGNRPSFGRTEAERGFHQFDTPPIALGPLFEHEPLLAGVASVCEPFCGLGNLVIAMRQRGLVVHASDIVDRGCPDSTVLDFLKMTERPAGCDVLLSNPPYRKAMQYIEHALKLKFRVIALLLKVNFMCTSERYERLHKLGHLRQIHVFAERLQDMHDANFTGKKASQSQVHGWYVLHRDYCGPATINPVSIHAPDVRMPWLSGRFCEQCRKPYRARRGDSKFCSDACRQRAYRERPKRNASVTRDTDDEPRRPAVGNARGDETMSVKERKEGRYWTNEDGTTGYRPFTDDNFEDCQHCGRPHGDEVEIVQGKDRAIVYLHAECEAAYRQRWGDKIIISSQEVATAVTPRGEADDFD